MTTAIHDQGVTARGHLHSSDRARWQAEYGRRLALSDAVVVIAAVAIAQVVRFGGLDGGQVPLPIQGEFGYSIVSVGIAAAWLTLLSFFNTRSQQVIGSGAEEYRRIASASFRLFGVIAIASFLAHLELARGYLAIAFPLGLAGLMVNRQAWRKNADRMRRLNRYQTSVLVVGGHYAVRATALAFAREPMSGYRVVGVCTPEGPTAELASIDVGDWTIPIVGTDRSVLESVDATGADAVALTATDNFGPGDIRKLVWDLDPLGVDLIVTPGVVDVAGQRLESRPVAGMPMLHVEKPQYDRARKLGKKVFDFGFATFAMLVIAPIMAVVAIAIKLTSRGAVFYKAERIGMNGEPFQMIKFRSMYEDADQHVADLAEANDGAGPLFKMKDDPRVTAVGRILRRYSIDELPQFLNVLRGEMSVVGPRPPLRREVEQYNGTVRRRLMVKPGVTGLWQVSGRSDLSWNESVRLDLSYIENWSMIQDLLIIKKTLSAVTGSAGAY
ncbi:sugar transferase [Antrihabitans sp. YC2-6]|uniref:sugar transferase n=1 Tax=Antrihabitans sp. YC2-6 TaxID=2799498 RepID=UPI0018F350E9|nr:sugar transferase [Antrihabitans sp. YC2-6]MBJ8343512.1 sugar transferase [Antrihabitans sp. YC2-6]